MIGAFTSGAEKPKQPMTTTAAAHGIEIARK